MAARKKARKAAKKKATKKKATKKKATKKKAAKIFIIIIIVYKYLLGFINQ